MKARSPIMSTLLIAIFAYLAWATLMFVAQRSIMFPGAGLDSFGAISGGTAEGIESVQLPFSAGSADAFFVSALATGTGPGAIFAHGNAELIENGLRDAVSLAGMGVSVLVVEYPGYGRSDGRPSRESIGEVFTAAYDWLAARPDIDQDRIIGVGRSLGTGAITDLARVRSLRALVLQSAFTSVASFARRYLLPGFLARDRFDNLEVLSSFAGPVLLIHGTDDEVIPYSHGERLARASANVELISLDCGHNDCPPDWPAWEKMLEEFLARAGVLDPGPQSAAPHE